MEKSIQSVQSAAQNNKSRFRLRIRLIIFSLVLFGIALGFNVIFTSASLDKLYIDSMISKYRIAAMSLQRKVETGLRYGKTLETYHSLERLAEQTSQDITETIQRAHTVSSEFHAKFSREDIGLAVTSVGGKVLYLDNKRLPLIDPRVALETKTTSNAPKSNYSKSNNTYYSQIEIRDKQGKVAGFITLSFAENKINLFIKDIFNRNIMMISIVAAIGAMILVLFVHLLTFKKDISNGWPKRKISIIIFVVIGSVQILTCGILTTDYNDYFFQVNKENTTTINEQLADDVAYLLSYGVKIDQLVGFEVYLKKFMSTLPELMDITYFDRSHQPLYRATKDQVTDFKRSTSAYDQWVEAIKPPKNPEFNAVTPVCKQNTSCGYFSSNLSKDILSGKVIDIALDSLTIIIISILFFVELLILISNYFEQHVKQEKKQSPVHYSAMRPAAFLFLFGIDLSMSFLPLYAEKLYEPGLGFTKDTIMGLPISVEFLFVGIAILIAGIWLDKKGWHQPFIAGLVLAVLGTLYSWLAPDAIHFILSRAVLGLGYGLCLMASQGFVIAYSDQKSKAQGLAHLFAGIYAGSICGNATGAIMAEWLGYATVFLGSSIIILIVMVYTLTFMRQGMRPPEPVSPALQKVPGMKGQSIWNFLTNRTILGLILFSSLPAAIAVIGFLNYFSPIYLDDLGASQSTIGQILMLYGICLIYFGPFISRYVDASSNKAMYIFVGCVLGGLALLTFKFIDGIAAAVLAVLLLGFSSSLVLASQSAYALKLNVTKELGEGKAIAIFRSTSRIGQMLGPIVFSAVIVATNQTTGMTWLGAGYLVLAILFIVITQTDKKTLVTENA